MWRGEGPIARDMGQAVECLAKSRHAVEALVNGQNAPGTNHQRIADRLIFGLCSRTKYCDFKMLMRIGVGQGV